MAEIGDFSNLPYDPRGLSPDAEQLRNGLYASPNKLLYEDLINDKTLILWWFIVNCETFALSSGPMDEVVRNPVASIPTYPKFCNQMNRKIFVTDAVERVWDIEGYPNYFFGHDKQLYRYDLRGRVRRNKQIVIGYTMGYVLKSKFFSIARLRPMLRRHQEEI